MLEMCVLLQDSAWVSYVIIPYTCTLKLQKKSTFYTLNCAKNPDYRKGCAVHEILKWRDVACEIMTAGQWYDVPNVPCLKYSCMSFLQETCADVPDIGQLSKVSKTLQKWDFSMLLLWRVAQKSLNVKGCLTPLYTLSHKNGATLILAPTLSNVKRPWIFLQCLDANEFFKKTHVLILPHLKHVAALPWKIGSLNLPLR